MKREYVLIILISTILGILLGGLVRENKRREDNYISKDAILKKEIKTIEKSIKNQKNEKEKLDEKYDNLKEKYEDIEKVQKVDEIKEKLSYTDKKGKGVIIKIDSLNEEIGNIANFIDYNKILVKLVNELKANGGEYISINNQRINQYSEMVLAGNHININSNPIAPPYEIKCMGNIEKLSSVYMDRGSEYIKNIQSNYPLKVEIKVDKNIELEKMSVPNKLKYIKGE